MRRHEPDVLSLVCGLFFLGVAALWGLWGADNHAVGGWRLPALLIAVGVIGLVATLARRPRAETGEPGEPLDPYGPTAEWPTEQRAEGPAGRGTNTEDPDPR